MPIIGTSVDTIEDAEDREKFKDLLTRLSLKQPANGIARTTSQARNEAAQDRLSGAGAAELRARRPGDGDLLRPAAVGPLRGRCLPCVAEGQPVLIDRFLEDATEVDVDAIADGQQVIVAGIMEHIEEAGVHSGDSACAIPPYSLQGPVVAGDPRGHLGHGPGAARSWG